MTTTGQVQLTYNVAEVAIHIGDKSRTSTRCTHRPLLSTFSPPGQHRRPHLGLSATTAKQVPTHQHRDRYRAGHQPADATSTSLIAAETSPSHAIMTTSAGRRSVDSTTPCSTGGHHSDMGIRRGSVMEKVANVFCGGANTHPSSVSTCGVSTTMKSFSSTKTTSSSSYQSPSPPASSSQDGGRAETITVSPAMVRRDVNAKAVLKKEKPPVPPRDRSTICRSRQGDFTATTGSNVYANSYTVPSSSFTHSDQYVYSHSNTAAGEAISHSSIFCLSAIDSSPSNIGNQQRSSPTKTPLTTSLPSEAYNQAGVSTKPSSNVHQQISQPPMPPQRSKPIPPDKPSRFSFQKMFASQQALVAGAARGVYGGVISTGARSPRVWRKQTSSSSLQSSSSSGTAPSSIASRSRIQPPPFTSWEELWQQEKFLDNLFRYVLPSVSRTQYYENNWGMASDGFVGDSVNGSRIDEESVFAVCRLSSVCRKWRDVLYRRPNYWNHLRLCLDCHEMRTGRSDEEALSTRQHLFGNLQLRLFDSISLINAQDDDLSQLPMYFPAASRCLQSLQLSAGRFSDRGLEQVLSQLASLTSLQLSGCNEITDAALWSGLQPRICQLSVTDCINISDEAVAAVAQLLPVLEEFSLQAYHVTDTALTYFAHKASSNCTTLRLQSCWELTNHAALNIANSLPNLRVLSLAGCSKITDEGIEIIAENVKGLRSLNVSWCMRVTDTALEVIACDLGQLQELILDRCIHVSDVGVGYLSTLSSLRTLSIRWCTHVHDAGMQHVCSMRQLRVLRLSGCTHISAEALSNLTQLRHLSELELTNCPGGTEELHTYLSERLPRCTVYN